MENVLLSGVEGKPYIWTSSGSLVLTLLRSILGMARFCGTRQDGASYYV